MRRLVVPLVALLVFLGVEAAARVLDGRIPDPVVWGDPFQQTKAEQIGDLAGAGVEVVFVGSSVAQADFDPPLFAEASTTFGPGYNAAIPSATPRLWRLFTADTVHQDLCPALLVVGVDIRQYNDNKPGTEGQVLRYLESRGRRAAVGERSGWEAAEGWLEDRLALVRIRSRLREPDKLVAWVWEIGDIGGWRKANVTPEGRYRSFDRLQFEPPATGIADLRRNAFRDFAVGGAEEEALQGIVGDARARGIEVIMVVMPAMFDEMARALPRGQADVAAFKDSVAAAAARVGAPLFTFPEFENRAELFGDTHHMNRFGVEAITTALAERVDALGVASSNPVCGPADS